MTSTLLIGTGRLAFHLGHALVRSGIRVAGVAGRNAGRTEELAAILKCPAFQLDAQLPKVDLRIVAVSDDAIGPVAARLPTDGTPIIHLSGSKPTDLLLPHQHRGVLWPIRSFNPGDPVDFSKLPLIVDAQDAGTLHLLLGVAHGLSGNVHHLPMEQRQHLHLSAVIAANFPAFLLREAERLLKGRDIEPSLIEPLWKAMAEKAVVDADASVTGPARRGDLQTIHLHKDLLADEPELRAAYSALSDLILHTYHPETRGQQDL
jgi:predicted short-subunit dehydrogenase-like oxidoreductase (DUF2520 family)